MACSHHEQKLRMLLNVLFGLLVASIILKNPVANFHREPTLLEEICFKAVKFSLEIPVIPIKKFLILFYIFLRLNLGRVQSKFLYSIQLNSWTRVLQKEQGLQILERRANPNGRKGRAPLLAESFQSREQAASQCGHRSRKVLQEKHVEWESDSTDHRSRYSSSSAHNMSKCSSQHR